MYRILNFDIIIFFVHKINSKIVKSEIVVLTGREKTNITDADVTISLMLQLAAGCIVDEKKREI
jgi:hypothetical protein